MAASDPTMAVPTPTGALQGVAAFSWDGSAWQPSGRAGPSVATPTGVLQGVAPFSWDGASWQPSGRAQPGVAAPGGVLDGVAVYTWSGSAWVPASGQPTPSTPSGALRGVAAFNWDGSAWQPVGQARPSVATPYGVLDGVAMFGWTGSAWAAVGAPSLNMSFMAPGVLDARVTFTRASTGTYLDATGTLRTAAINAPRWEYSSGTLRGLLLEDTRTNLLLNSADVSQATWQKLGNIAAAPVVTANQTAAPDGTVTAAMVVYPAVSGAGAYSQAFQPLAVGVNPYTFSVWLKGSVGGEQLYVNATPNGVLYYRTAVTLTTAWQRFTLITPSLTATTWNFLIGTDLRDASQTSKPTATIFVWGAQVEQATFASSYIPTAGASATRSQDQCAILPANMGWFTTTGSWQAEFILTDTAPNGDRIIGAPIAASGGVALMAAGTTPSYVLGEWDGATYVATTNTITPSAVQKGAISHTVPGSPVRLCLNGGPIAGPTNIANGFGPLATSGIKFFTTVSSANDDNGNGYIRSVRFWPRVLSDVEMQSVTS